MKSKVMVALIGAAMAMCSGCSLIQQSKSVGQSDVSLKATENLPSFSIVIEATPKVDIATLTVKVKLYKEDEKTVISSYDKTQKDLLQGETYQYYFTLSVSDVLYCAMFKYTFEGTKA